MPLILVVKPYKLQFFQAGGETWGSTTSFPDAPHLPAGTWVWCLKVAGARGKYHYDGHLTEAGAHAMADQIESDQSNILFNLASRPMRIFGSKQEAIVAAHRNGYPSSEIKNHHKLYGRS